VVDQIIEFRAPSPDGNTDSNRDRDASNANSSLRYGSSRGGEAHTSAVAIVDPPDPVDRFALVGEGDVVREMTKLSEIRDRSVVTSSVMTSTK